jgi:hypothetical protein
MKVRKLQRMRRPNIDQKIDANEAARLLFVSRSHLDKLVRSGKVTATCCAPTEPQQLFSRAVLLYLQEATYGPATERPQEDDGGDRPYGALRRGNRRLAKKRNWRALRLAESPRKLAVQNEDLCFTRPTHLNQQLTLFEPTRTRWCRCDQLL